MNVYLICSGILVIVYFLLANNVSVTRVRTKVGFGTDDDPTSPLNRAIRAHARCGVVPAGFCGLNCEAINHPVR